MVAIKDMDTIPENCSDCGLWHYSRYEDEPICNITLDTIKVFHKRCDSCPLIEINPEQ